MLEQTYLYRREVLKSLYRRGIILGCVMLETDNNTSANAIRRGTGTTDSSGKFEIDISLPPGIGVYSYYGSTSTHYFDICGVSVSPSDDSSISASETIFHLAYTMYHPF